VVEEVAQQPSRNLGNEGWDATGQHPQVRRAVADGLLEERVAHAGAVVGRAHVERVELQQVVHVVVARRAGGREPDQPLAVLGQPDRPRFGQDPAPVVDALVHPLAPVVEDALRHQPGVGVVPDVEVQVGERLGVGRLRGPDGDAFGESHGPIVGLSAPRSGRGTW
jgi:hypothetical protein